MPLYGYAFIRIYLYTDIPLYGYAFIRICLYTDMTLYGYAYILFSVKIKADDLLIQVVGFN